MTGLCAADVQKGPLQGLPKMVKSDIGDRHHGARLGGRVRSGCCTGDSEFIGGSPRTASIYHGRCRDTVGGTTLYDPYLNLRHATVIDISRGGARYDSISIGCGL
jgi:hypothetical protein